MDQPWAKEPVKSINSIQYNFDTFVTALHDSIQADQELQSSKLESEAEALINFLRNKQPTTATHLSTPEMETSDLFETLIGHFGRNPTDLKRRAFRRDTQPGYQNANPCRRCGSQWRPGHRCENGQTRSHIRDRLRKGDNHVHIISDLVNSIEEATETSLDEQEDLTNDPHLAELDRLVGTEDEYDNAATETGFITTHISNILNCKNPDNVHQDFQ